MKKITLTLALVLLCASFTNAQTKSPLTLQQTIPLPELQESLTTSAVDTERGLLFAAATGKPLC